MQKPLKDDFIDNIRIDSICIMGTTKLTREDIFDIKLPLSDEDYLKLCNGLKESHISLSYHNPELWIAFNKKVSEIYDARHPGNNLSWHEKTWEPPLSVEEKANLALESKPLIEEEFKKIPLPLSDDDYVKILFNMEKCKLALSTISQKLDLAFNKKASEYYDYRHPGNNLWFEDIPWEMPVTEQDKIDIKARDYLWTVKPHLTDEEYVKIHEILELSNLSLRQEFPDIEFAYQRKMVEIYNARHPDNKRAWDDIPWEPPLTAEEKRPLNRNNNIKSSEVSQEDFKTKNEDNTSNSIIDSKLLDIGFRMTFLIVKHCACNFKDYSRIMEEELGENIRKYLKAFYNGTRQAMLDCGNEVEKKIASEMDDGKTIEKMTKDIENDDSISFCIEDDEVDNTLAYMGIGNKKSKEREEIERAGFEIIKDSDGIDRGQWAYELIKTYPHEVIDEFGSNPLEVGGLIEEMWDTDDYEDPESGLTMRWPDWATFFSTDVAKSVYETLVDEHRKRQKYETQVEEFENKLGELKRILE